MSKEKTENKDKMFEIPEQLMKEIIGLINTLPYGQVAPIAAQLGRVLQQQGE
jgi:hypothetical protein